MAGMYIHIPFCKQACHYCDFHFSTNLKQRSELLFALREEMRLRRGYLEGARLSSIYLGGGTPSLLSGEEVGQLLDAAAGYYGVEPGCEVTLEANPDDLDPMRLAALRAAGINRLSIGVQSFFDEDLRWMNRAHTGNQAFESVVCARQAGFENLTVDLIYGFPLLSDRKWLHNIERVISLDIPHVSCYNLTVEEGTALNAFIKKGRERAMSSSQGARHFELLINELCGRGYRHYEISNFCLEGAYSRHNTAYWQEKAYVGIGPSAHSYNGRGRSWNVSNNGQYVKEVSGIKKRLNEDEVLQELPGSGRELLSEADRFNERVMTGLRTMWGVDLQRLEGDFGEKRLETLRKSAGKYLRMGWVLEENGFFRLSPEGKLYADRIAADLFLVPG